jgi:hypothetical protein
VSFPEFSYISRHPYPPELIPQLKDIGALQVSLATLCPYFFSPLSLEMAATAPNSKTSTLPISTDFARRRDTFSRCP